MTMRQHEQPGGTLFSTGSNVAMNYSSEYLDPSPQYQLGQRQAPSESGLEQTFNFAPEPTKNNHWGGPVANFLSNPEVPWAGIPHDGQPHITFHRSYVPSPGSENGSASRRSDSGYGTMNNAAQSGNGSDSLVASRMFVDKPGKKVINSISGTRTMKKPNPKHTLQGNSSQRTWPCPLPECGKTLNCQSAYDKHKRMHEKPYHCEYLGCNYTNGFTTKNDLDRHLKSKHLGGIDNKSKSWQCQGNGCKNPTKIWPRFDNFKQHVTKMHPEEDTNELIKKSQIDPKKLPDDRAAPGGERKAINPLDLNMQGSVPTLSIAPELKVTTSDVDGTTDSLLPTVDLSRLSPISASSHNRQVRGRNRIRSPAPHPRPSSHSVSSNVTRTGLDTLAVASEIQAASHAPGSRPNGATARSGAVSPEVQVQLDAIRIILSGLIPSSVANTQNSSNITAQSNGQQPISNLDTSQVVLRELLKLQALQQPIMSHANVSGANSNSNADEDCEEGESFPCPQEGCPKRLRRQCELNKHMKRHTKPYGCTFSQCYKRFGSKNDWKRHENSQHFQIELWKCQEVKPDKAVGICGEPFYTEERIINHLTSEHRLFPANAQARATICHVGRNNQTRFWCGFCGKVRRLDKVSGLEAWEERFSHIDSHFKSGEIVDDWIDDITHRPKGKKEKRKSDDQSSATGPQTATQSSSALNPQQSASSNKRSRSVSADKSLPASQKARLQSHYPVNTYDNRVMWECCSCGGFGGQYDDSCPNCSHIKCDNCNEDDDT